MIDDLGKIKNIEDIDINLLESLEKIFKNDVNDIENEKELLIKKGNLEVVSFIRHQYEIINGENND